MHVNLEMTQAEEYFGKTDRKIDWEEDGSGQISVAQADTLQRILTAEASIHILRRVTGLCGSLVDNMTEIRRDLINQYEMYEPYVHYRDFS
jgi:hypothetical protein